MKLLILCLAALPLVWGGMAGLNLEDMMKEVMGSDGEHKDTFSDFKGYLKDQHNPEESDAEFMHKMKANIMSFKDYVKAQQYKHMMEVKEEQAAKKKEKLMMMKDLLGDKMEHVADDLKHSKEDFKYYTVKHVLSFCHCEDDGTTLLKRVKEGDFGHWENDTMPHNGNDSISDRNITGNHTTDDHSWNFDGVDIPRQMDFAKHLMEHADPMENVGYAMKYLQKVMCGAAHHYIHYLSDLEVDVHDFLENRTVTPPPIIG